MLLNKTAEQAVLKNKRIFESLLKRIGESNSLTKRARLAKKAIRFAINNSTGYYSSEIIENVFIDIAQTICLESEIATFNKNSFLHVMTESYEVGGHTRVVERWIELSGKDEIHSLVFTEKQNQIVPQRLQKAITDKNGTITKLADDLKDEDKALQLRQLASKFEYIILHVHMHDIIPLLAFGHPQFHRPVIWYNHADHLFWVGLSIADVVAETRSWGAVFTKTKRGYSKSQVLGIPVDISINKNESKIDLKKELGLPLDKKVILTTGSPHKYRPLENLNFLEIVSEILRKNQDSILVGIGPDFTHLPEWEKSSLKLGGRILALGRKSPGILNKYAMASDLALDSFPMSGGTALTDLTSAGCPVLSYSCPTDHLDYIKETSAYCTDKFILIEKASELLNNRSSADKNVEEVTNKLIEHNGSINWLKRLRHIYASVHKHEIQKFITPQEIEIDSLDEFHFSDSQKSKLVFGFAGLLSVYAYRKNGKIRIKLKP